MNWLEIIQLRTHSKQEADDTSAAFRQLSPPKGINGLAGMSLFRNGELENDLSICLYWRGRPGQKRKSPLGLQLAAAFSEFGQIHHAIWDHQFNLFQQKEKS